MSRNLERCLQEWRGCLTFAANRQWVRYTVAILLAKDQLRSGRVGAVRAGGPGRAGPARTRGNCGAGGSSGPGGSGGYGGPGGQGRNGDLDLAGRVAPGKAGLYRLVQAGWGGVGVAGWVQEGWACWWSIGYGPGRVLLVVPVVIVPINGSLGGGVLSEWSHWTEI